MTDENNDFERYGEYRSSDGPNVGLGLTLLFVGLAVGAAAALLLAPQTGKQMRRSLRRKYEDARELMDDIGEQASDWVEKGSEWADKAKRGVAPLSDRFRK
jgi:gas vesicle protein